MLGPSLPSMLRGRSPVFRLDRKNLRISCFWMVWAFPRRSVLRLHRHPGLGSVGLRIEHSVRDYNQFIVLWSPRFDELAAALAGRGYAVG